MRIDRLELRNFRKFAEATFEFPRPVNGPAEAGSFHVLIGDNGTGKTSILDATAVALGSAGACVTLTARNEQLTAELTAINQYFLHARMYRHWGFEKIAKKEYEESIGEMKHADKLIDRILMLDGLPNLQALHKIMIGETTEEMIACDLKLEKGAQATVNHKCVKPLFSQQVRHPGAGRFACSSAIQVNFLILGQMLDLVQQVVRFDPY